MKRFVILGFVLAFGTMPAFAGGSCSGSSATQASITGDIVATASSAGSFNTLVAAVQAAGLVETLQSEGPFTVFAPTDEAFAKLPEGTVEALLADIPALTDVLLYHVAHGKRFSGDVLDSDRIRMLNGDFTWVDAENLMINDAGLVPALIDVEASNGVIHVIDTVLLP